ncbi:hypothetical protein [Glycomyces paridis]|uniref:Uncharacterized protein n=1 Tax=Glycomyces paridis TaxID=2126555 RepID=A0A4S8P8Q8_9ACTN|nr:hypothetical protein [Glycomyces paridis]THV25985.1 hypothetical protein E9998_19825 [Glycomyces paridis]
MTTEHTIDPTYVLAGVIHGSTCEDSPPECIEYEGACVKAAKAIARSLAGWTVGPSNDGSVDAGLYHTCESEPVSWMDGQPVGAVLGIIADHTCEATR